MQTVTAVKKELRVTSPRRTGMLQIEEFRRIKATVGECPDSVDYARIVSQLKESDIHNSEKNEKPYRIRKWIDTTLRLKNEGFWVPLKINDVPGLLAHAGEIRQLGKRRQTNGEWLGRNCEIALKVFLEVLGGIQKGKSYTAPERGILNVDLIDALIERTGRTASFFEGIVLELRLEGILRKAVSDRRIIMIPTIEQLDMFINNEVEQRKKVKRFGEY